MSDCLKVMKDLPLQVGNYLIRELLGQGRTGHNITGGVSLRQLELMYKGTFGTVYRGVSLLTGDDVAIKVVDSFACVKEEVELWKRLEHPNIVKLYEVVVQTAGRNENTEHAYLIMEIGNEEMYEYLVRKKRLESNELRIICKQLVEAVKYLHEQNIVHRSAVCLKCRDLKLENILLDENQNLKLVDFGFASAISSFQVSNHCGSIAYLSPEIINRQNYDPKKADIWAIGVIIYTLAVGCLPFDDDVELKVQVKIRNLDYSMPDFLDLDLRNMIMGILKKDPEERLSLDQILSHHWMEKETKLFLPDVGQLKEQRQLAVIQGLVQAGIRYESIEDCFSTHDCCSPLYGLLAILSNRKPTAPKDLSPKMQKNHILKSNSKAFKNKYWKLESPSIKEEEDLRHSN